MLKVQWYFDENNKHYYQGTKYIFKSNAITQKKHLRETEIKNHIQYDNQLNKASLKE